MSIELYDRALGLWGSDAQARMLLEECAELIVVLSHLDRGRVNVRDLAEEMADVEIMLGQMRRAIGDRLVDDVKVRKLERLRERVELGELARKELVRS